MKKLLIALLATLTIATTASAEFSLGIAPVRPNVESPSKIYFELQPGDQITEAVEVTNNMSGPQSLTVSALEENSFIKPTVAEITLEPGETKQVDYQIVIPADAEQKEYTDAIKFKQKADDVALDASGIKNVIAMTKQIKIKVTESPRALERVEIITTWQINWPIVIYAALSLIIFIAVLFQFRKGDKKAKK